MKKVLKTFLSHVPGLWSISYIFIGALYMSKYAVEHQDNPSRFSELIVFLWLVGFFVSWGLLVKLIESIAEKFDL